MKKISLILVLCLIMGIFSGCGAAIAGNLTAKPTTEATEEPTEKPTEKPTTEATEEPTTEATEEPTTEPTEAPTTEPITEPTEPESDARVVAGFFLKAPDGFVEYPTEDDLPIWVATDESNSNINVNIAEYTEEDLHVSVEDIREAFELFFTSVEDIRWIELDGLRTLYAEYTYEVDEDMTMRAVVCELYADRLYTFTFADLTENGAWMEAYRESAKTIHLLAPGEEAPVIEKDDPSELPPFNYDGLTRYDLNCGFVLYAEDGLEFIEDDSFTDFLANDYMLFLSTLEAKADLTDVDTLADYADLIAEVNELDAFTVDAYGNLATTYTFSEGAVGWWYYTVVKETDDTFCLVQFVCLMEDMEGYANLFPGWAASLEPLD